MMRQGIMLLWMASRSPVYYRNEDELMVVFTDAEEAKAVCEQANAKVSWFARRFLNRYYRPIPVIVR